jgi:hypothetical protein
LSDFRDGAPSRRVTTPVTEASVLNARIAALHFRAKRAPSPDTALQLRHFSVAAMRCAEADASPMVICWCAESVSRRWFKCSQKGNAGLCVNAEPGAWIN